MILLKSTSRSRRSSLNFVPQFNRITFKRFATLNLDMWHNVGSSASTWL